MRSMSTRRGGANQSNGQIHLLDSLVTRSRRHAPVSKCKCFEQDFVCIPSNYTHIQLISK